MLATIIAEFRDIVDAVYGMFLDARDGLSRVRDKAAEMEEESKRSIEDLKTQRPELAGLEYGGAEFSYGRWVPARRQPRYRHLHQVSVETLKQRNEEGGTNFQLIGDVCLVTLFQYWEEHYRPLLAQALGVEKNQIQVPLFGELRWYRHAIIHNRGVATSDVEACTILKFFKRGDQIIFNREMFEQIIDGVFGVLENLEKEPGRYVNPP